MSRLIVKGLPKYLTEDKLKEHFAKKGDVTDVKLMKKRNGESRRFAFVGFKSSESAEQAVRFFNGSFIDTAKIDVQVAKSFADPTVPISFKEKRRLDFERHQAQEDRLLKQEEERKAKKQKTLKTRLADEIASNPALKEYVETMKPSGQKQSWANGDFADGKGAPSTKALEEALAKQDGVESEDNVADVNAMEPSFNVKENASDDEYEDFNTKNDEEDDEEMIPLDQISDDKETSNDNEEATLAKDENVSDLEWLQQKRIRMIENEERAKEIERQNPQKPSPQDAPTKVQKSSPTPEVDPETEVVNKISETGRLFIRNILYTSTEDDYRELFSPFGELEEVHMAIDTRTGKSKGFVYVQFANPENAVTAYQELDKHIFQGRLLHILPGQKKKDHRMDEFDIQNLPLKKQRELKKKAQASKSQFSWNSLYMNQDAVMESVAAKMGVSKSDLIDAQSSDSAVKQALAEAHVIGDVRGYFEKRGVDLASFSKKERDDKIILIKNFSFGTTIAELGDLFSQHGEIKRILMPPAGTIAIVEFRDSPSARAAFTKLAYKRLGKSILYLEKGPKDLFTREPAEDEGVDSIPVEEKAVEAKASAKDILIDDKANDDEEETAAFDGPTVSVFVKNLNFATTTKDLSDAFKSLPGFAVATVKTKPDPKKEGSTLSMGFGFAEFRSKEDAENAIAVMDGHVLDGHKLQLKISNRTSGSSQKTKSGKKSTKIIIKNLPFEATRKDIVELFGAFGHLKSARVPKKFDRSARGFAFVEFNTLKESESAMNQLEGVHLLGRRLVMDYAEKDAENAEIEIERMTNKVKQQYSTQQLAAQRLAGHGKKLDIDQDESPDSF